MSDHISGPRALAEPIADITDVYAFPSPEREGQLVLVQNTLPFAQPSALFSDGLVYRFRLRPLSARAPSDPAPFAVAEEEFVFDCVFSDPAAGDGEREQEGACTTPAGDTVTFRVNDEQGGSGHGLRVFAGPRWDPFIMDAPAALKTIATGKLAFTDPGAIYMDGKNVLSLVVEVDCAQLLKDVDLVGVVAETLTRGRLAVRIERVGRPEVKNMMLAPKQFDQVNRDLEIRDLYNMEDAFHLGDGYEGAYRARLNANLAFWDGLDGKTDWPTDGNGTHPLTELVLADYLVVDPSKPYAEQGSFLEIERATREGGGHQTCGGRALNDDVIDTIFTLLVNAGNGPVIRDGVDQSTRPALEVRFEGADHGPYHLKPVLAETNQSDLRFVRSLALAHATDPAAEILIAYEMNGQPLIADHGSPFRLIVPHWYAVASVKWLKRIDVLTEPYVGEFQTGHYMYEWPDREHERVTLMRVRARITDPAPGATIATGEGDWHSAKLEPPKGSYQWQDWSLDWEVSDVGRHSLRARATDAAGNVQPDVPPWNRLGYGNNAIEVSYVDVR